MDIVDRLKQFIDFLEIPVTKFADNCEIPRPTLSQLTNGRNKSVRNELVEKIHRAYPDLSMIWLMFGEGDMLHKENIKTSEPQKAANLRYESDQSPITDMVMPTFGFESDESLHESENDSESELSSQTMTGASIEFGESMCEPSSSDFEPSALTFTSDSSKHVVRIIAYYSDNSYQEFYPR